MLSVDMGRQVAMRNNLKTAAGWLVVSLSIFLSIASLYVKLFFWGGTRYAGIPTKLLFWYIIIAGPLAAVLMYRRLRLLPILLILFQFLIVVVASI